MPVSACKTWRTQRTSAAVVAEADALWADIDAREARVLERVKLRVDGAA